jgi:hypothetical protein
MRSPVVALLALMLAVTTGQAQSKGPRVVKLTLTPAGAPTPALKYHLLPWVSELQPGNGAVFYQRAHSPEWIQPLTRLADYNQLYDLLEQPWQSELASKLQPFAATAALRELDHGARCEYVDWQLTSRLREDNYSLLIPDVQAMRTLAQFLSARLRLEIHRGEIDKAVASLQTGLALSRDLAQTPLLISCLVGFASAHFMLNRVEELIQLPNTPSLYWAFTELPEGIFDLRRGLQGERLSVDGLFPEIRQALLEKQPTAISPAVMRQRLEKFDVFGDRTPAVGYAAIVAVIYPQARAHFLQQGRSAEQLDALPVTQVVLMYELADYDRWMDEYLKNASLPYWQARPRFNKMHEDLRAARTGQTGGSLLTRTLLPAIHNVMLSQARIQRRFALLRTVEALRLHAAAHAGKLPETLEEVNEVPLPLDPVTGKAFVYQRQSSQRATLDALPPPGEEANETNAARYEITLAAAPPRPR